MKKAAVAKKAVAKKAVAKPLQKEKMVRVPLKDWLRLKPDDFDNPRIEVLFKLSQNYPKINLSTLLTDAQSVYKEIAMTKGTELQIANLIATSMKNFDNIRDAIYDSVRLYEEITTSEDEKQCLNGLA